MAHCMHCIPVISVDLVNIVLCLADKIRGIALQHLHLHPGLLNEKTKTTALPFLDCSPI
jgi:hypothetical protein